MAKTTDVTTAAKQTPAQIEEAAALALMVADAGSGFEEASLDCFAIPFISVLQSGSPQCKKSDGAYIKGAEEGMFYDSVTNEVISGEEGIFVVPFYFAHRFIAWGLRESGGGFKGEFLPSDPIVKQTTRDKDGRDVINHLPDQQLVDTRVHYVLRMGADGFSPAVLSLSSTQMKKSKQWMSRMQAMQIPTPNGPVPAPMASHVWHLTTVPESNDKGSWFGLKVGAPLLLLDAKAYAKANDLRKQVMAGKAGASYETPVSSEEKDDF